MSRLGKKGLLDWLTTVQLPKYELCLSRKATIKPFRRTISASSPLELIHSNMCRPMNVKARHRAIYFITLTDDYSQYRYVHLLCHCYEVLDVFKCFIAEVKTQLKRRVKILWNDRGCEYVSYMFKKFCEGKWIQRQLTIPHTLQRNDVAKHGNWILLGMVRPMMAYANLLIGF